MKFYFFLLYFLFNIAILRNVIYNMEEVIDLIRLKELRKEIKYTQRDVANHLGITQPAYANYENGSRQADYDTLNKLADLFNVSVDYILGRTDEITPKPDNVELENDVIIYNRNGKIVKRKMSKEKMDMLASMIDAIPEDNNPDL